MKTEEPAVSVLISTQNRAEYLHMALESMATQTFTDWEWVVIDDGSVDATPDVLESYQQKLGSRMQVLRNEPALGLIKSLNRGLDAARGKYIARMDDDDVSKPERLAKQVAFMEKHPDVVLLGTGGHYLQVETLLINDYVRPRQNVDIRLALTISSPFIHPTVMMRASTLKKKGLRYDENFKHAEDFELWTRLIDHGRAAILPDKLLTYRAHSARVTKKHRDYQAKITAEIRDNYTKELLRDTSLSGLSSSELQQLLHPRVPATLAQILQVRDLYEAVARSSHVSAAEVKEAFARWLAPHLDARSARNLASWTGMRMLTASGAYVWPYLLERSARLMRHQFNRR